MSSPGRPLAALVVAVGLALAAAPARAASASHDVVVLRTGERLVGEIVDLRDGAYVLLLTDGTTVTLPLRTVVSVTLGDAPDVTGDLPLPSWQKRGRNPTGPVGGGFDVGTGFQGIARFRPEKGAVAHVDVGGGIGLAVLGAQPSGFTFATKVDVAFGHDATAHPVATGMLGAATIFGGFEPFVALGGGVQIDPVGPFEVRLGAVAGVSAQGFTWVPDLKLAWVW